MPVVSAPTYVSTRSTGAPDRNEGLGFADVLLAGMAPDGGLYVPIEVPNLPRQSQAELPSGAGAYSRLAAELLAGYVGDAIDLRELTRITEAAYATFDHPEVCPLTEIDEDHHLMELFHGPTFAFKDVALQVVARLFDHELERRDERVTIVGATSGDTGSAAMQAVAGRDRINIVILHPEGRTSEMQRRQMTTLEADNVHAVATDGTFDDCQDLVKAMFADAAFRTEMRLAAVNSINWARVVTQIVYYVWAHLRLGAKRPVTFCVPTGNFGNVLAGHYARRMGLDVQRLLVASNANDILTRLLRTGELSASEVVPTWSPSMDIQISSNLERLLHELFDGDGEATASLLGQFRATGRAKLSTERHRRLREGFEGGRLSDPETLDVMAEVHAQSGMFIDPHTAVGVGVARQRRRRGELMVTLATAHPAKFGDAVAAATGSAPPMPEALAALEGLPERCTHLPNDLGEVQAFVRSVAAQG